MVAPKTEALPLAGAPKDESAAPRDYGVLTVRNLTGTTGSEAVTPYQARWFRSMAKFSDIIDAKQGLRPLPESTLGDQSTFLERVFDTIVRKTKSHEQGWNMGTGHLCAYMKKACSLCRVVSTAAFFLSEEVIAQVNSVGSPTVAIKLHLVSDSIFCLEDLKWEIPNKKEHHPDWNDFTGWQPKGVNRSNCHICTLDKAHCSTTPYDAMRKALAGKVELGKHVF